MKKLYLTILSLAIALAMNAEDGSRLWLRLTRNAKPAKVISTEKSPIVRNAVSELDNYWDGAPVTLTIDETMPDNEGFTIKQTLDGITIKARRDAGLLYGAFALLRSRFSLPDPRSPLSEAPAFPLRLLNHWDNPDRSVERGYAGESIWKWGDISGSLGTMTDDLHERIIQYARANASIGINGTVLNNVNAKPEILTKSYIKRVKVIANLLRTYNIKTYLSVNFASPMALGKLPTADPLDANVQRWWKDKVAEIYKEIPDFGGFLVKANSEGQPGPGDYHRTHAEGANMLAAALKPYGGYVFWRCFVYGANHKGEDRVKQAVSEFKPLDGQFADNVILQTKNGPLDFQPREPYSPVFDQIVKTPNMAELQITQEYLGQSKHLVYLAPMWKEFFGFVSPSKLKGVAGVANIGDDANWCGHHFSQANWYAFGRLAWNPNLSAEEIADEWLAQTFDLPCAPDSSLLTPHSSLNEAPRSSLNEVMMASREACVDYMMPLGLHHIFKFDHHYGPEPDGYRADYPIEWCPVYYHKADPQGIGFDRSSQGTDAVIQYREPYRSLYDNLETCPEEYLLWFHHVSWNYTMRNGLTLWTNLCHHYNRGVAEAERFKATWQTMRPYIDDQRFREVSERLDIQVNDAREWRDVCLKYFGNFAHAQDGKQWSATWAAAPQHAAENEMPTDGGLNDCALRQIIHVSTGGDVVRLKLSNRHSSEPVAIKSIFIADADEMEKIDARTAIYITFGGKKDVTIAERAEVTSDAVKFNLKPLQRLSITINYISSPKEATAHLGSRTTSYIIKGAATPQSDFSKAKPIDHWYNIAALDICAEPKEVIAVIGNSITDGRGSTTNMQNRWTDIFAEQLHKSNPNMAVLNLGIGGNCVLQGGLGEPTVKRFDADILRQSGVSRVIIFEGVNDIGGSNGNSENIAGELTKAIEKLARQAKAKGLKVYGATITPFGKSFYDSPFHEAARQTVNEWIRRADCFDGVIDFDQAIKDPDTPSAMRADMHDNDWLHPNAKGHQLLGALAAESLL